MVLEIAGTTQPAALLYCLDSHDYSTIPSIDGYGWFTQEQVGWYRARSAAYTAANGGKPLPALAFSISPCPNTSLHGGTPTIRMSAVPPRMNAPGR